MAAETAGAGTGETTSGGVPAFDSAAFRADLLGEVNKTLNGFAKTLKTDISKLIPSKPVEPGEGAGAGEGEPVGAGTGEAPKQNSGTDVKHNTELQRLQKQVLELTNLHKKAESERDAERKAKLESERGAAIKDVLSGIAFKDDHSRKLFEKAIASDIVRDDAGGLVANTDKGPIDYKAYIEDYAKSVTSLLAPAGTGGAGARNGNGQITSQRGPQIEDLTAEKLKDPAFKAQASADIAAALKAAYSGSGG